MANILQKLWNEKQENDGYRKQESEDTDQETTPT
jgi:hypothetical protein